MSCSRIRAAGDSYKKAALPIKIYGAVTIGEKWKFMELEDTTVCIDSHDYYIEHLDKVFGILLHLTRRNRFGRTRTL